MRRIQLSNKCVFATFAIGMTTFIVSFYWIGVNHAISSSETPENPVTVYNSKIEKVMSERRKHLNEACKSIGRATTIDIDTFAEKRAMVEYQNLIYADTVNKIVFCANPKVGNTNLRHYFRVFSQNLTGSYEYTKDLGNIYYFDQSKHIKDLIQYESIEEAFEMLTTFKKIMFVRDPLDRLVSAWKNKFWLNNNPAELRVERQIIIKMVEPRATIEQLGAQLQIPLANFFEFLSKAHRPYSLLNYHWRPMAYTCLPCEIQYDYIGHLESMNAEIEEFVKMATGRSRVPKMPMPPNRRSEEDTFNELKNISKIAIKNLIEKIYKIDYQLFNYDIPT